MIFSSRLVQANIERFVDGDKKAIVFEDLFSLRLHVDAYHWHSNYEYSLINEENYIIRYVYLFDTGKNIDFSENSFQELLWESNFPNQGYANGYSCYVS